MTFKTAALSIVSLASVSLLVPKEHNQFNSLWLSRRSNNLLNRIPILQMHEVTKIKRLQYKTNLLLNRLILMGLIQAKMTETVSL